MDAIVKPWPKNAPGNAAAPLSDHVRAAPKPVEPRPTREEAEAAVRTLIAFAGDAGYAQACRRCLRRTL